MKTNKYVEDLKAKSAAELKEELVAAKKELFNLRFQNATNQLDNTSRIKEVHARISLEFRLLLQRNPNWLNGLKGEHDRGKKFRKTRTVKS